ncbi:hypothetical protein NLJ89_g5347 [Agrocybe chaxingu]|uniref:Uncharacterized protein n=1 Tax=Agrocybe chaxingu TaxID=84603 RepID=A0A9W8MWZ9_9AGAR|nr:hypothetical protein NLJ89_g5347 [Agrocybe chaxingu]
MPAKKSTAHEASQSVSESIGCPICKKEVSKRSLGAHHKACKRKAEEREADKATEKEIQAELDHLQKSPRKVPATRARVWDDPQLRKKAPTQPIFLPAATPVQARTSSKVVHNAPEACNFIPLDIHAIPRDSIQTEFHPHSGLKAKIESFEEYGGTTNTAVPPPTHVPWSPFESRADFEFAELALEAALTHDQVDRLLRHSLVLGNGFVTPYTGIYYPLTFVYKEESYEFWSRNLWEWALELVKNPLLAPHFTWDAVKLSKFDGAKFVRFIHEPWTANRWWEVQSVLPANGKPLFFFLYADQTKLSSFGSQKGYPIMARLANLPSEIRNGKGLGGGRVVGWLPIVDDVDDEHLNQKNFVDFKRVVWHECFRELLSSIATLSRTGFSVVCGDGIERLLFPIILILAADYEEQSVMTLIRGFRGLCPCPVCLVSRDELSKPEIGRLRSMEETQALVAEAQAGKAGIEAKLKERGLRPVENAFWDVELSDPYKAVSWDRMHSYAGGLGGKHIWPLLQKYIRGLGVAVSRKVDERWRDFNHFSKIVDIKFSDATKFEHLLKIALFVCHSAFDWDNHLRGYWLLRVLRKYLICDIYASLDVQTEDTIAAGRQALNAFAEALQEYIQASQGVDEKEKNWDFPKNHTHRHTYDDVLAKGATRNYNTKYDERDHGPLKDSYQLRSNFRDYNEQILRANHWLHVAVHIRSLIDHLDEHLSAERHAHEVEVEGEPQASAQHGKSSALPPPCSVGNVYLGAAQKPISVHLIAESRAHDRQFKEFGSRLSSFLKSAQVANADDSFLLLTEYRFLKVTYEDSVTGKAAIDYLRCTPNHFNCPRYDFVLIRTDAGPMFAQLVFLFTILVQQQPCPVALIRPFKREFGSARIKRKDNDLELLRLRQVGVAEVRFIMAESIIRGAPIFPAFDIDKDSLVFDVVDPDMYLRVHKFRRS